MPEPRGPVRAMMATLIGQRIQGLDEIMQGCLVPHKSPKLEIVAIKLASEKASHLVEFLGSRKTLGWKTADHQSRGAIL